MRKVIQTYLSGKSELEIHEEILKHSKEKGISTGKAFLDLLRIARRERDEAEKRARVAEEKAEMAEKGEEKSEQVIGLQNEFVSSLRSRLAVLEEENQILLDLVEEDDSEIRRKVLRAYRHNRRVKQIEKTEGHEEAMKWHGLHKGDEKIKDE